MPQVETAVVLVTGDCPPRAERECHSWPSACSIAAVASNPDALLDVEPDNGVRMDTAHRMTIVRRLVAYLANLAVFICLIGIGITAGSLLAATDAVEDWREDWKHHTSRR